MGCSTTKAKVIIIAIGSLQHVIALRAAVSVEFSGIQLIIQAMNDRLSQGVDSDM
jgi:hypothetical protein